MISEMIHTASLVHDDVIDDSDTRRGKNTINKVWGEKKVSNSSDYKTDQVVFSWWVPHFGTVLMFNLKSEGKSVENYGSLFPPGNSQFGLYISQLRVNLTILRNKVVILR